MPTSFRALNYSLDPNSENYAKLQFLYEFLESEFHTVMQEVRSSGIVYDKALIRNKSEFRNQFLADFGLRHKNNKWDAIRDELTANNLYPTTGYFASNSYKTFERGENPL